MPLVMTGTLFSYVSGNGMILHYCVKRLFSVVCRLSICLVCFFFSSLKNRIGVSVVKKKNADRGENEKDFSFFSPKLTYRSMNSRGDIFKIAVLDSIVYLLFFFTKSHHFFPLEDGAY